MARIRAGRRLVEVGELFSPRRDLSIGWSQLSNAREVPGAVALANLASNIQIVP
jgi:hypothetical protein